VAPTAIVDVGGGTAVRTELQLLLATGAVASMLLVPVGHPPAEADSGCRQSTWDQLNRHGVPRPMTFDGWADCPLRRGAVGFEKWSYPDYPIWSEIEPAEAVPAYQLIWVTNAAHPKTPLIDTHRARVRSHIRRAMSVIAGSSNRGATTRADLVKSGAPRVVGSTTARTATVQPVVDQVTVPQAVLRREPYQNWINPGTGQREMGLWPYLESHGYPARNDRRYITITDDAGVWNYRGAAAIVPCSGSGYGPADLDPDPAQNCNNAGGTWLTVSLSGEPDEDLEAVSGSSLGQLLAHEWAHAAGGVVEGAPNSNPLNFLHPSDCADLLCYNNLDQDGQHYDACGSAAADTWTAFNLGWPASAADSRAAFRMDCGRNDYFGLYLSGGVVAERRWTSTRWSGHRSRFLWGDAGTSYAGEPFSNLDHQIPPACTYDAGGWCPPGTVTAARSAGEPPAGTVWAVP
jgi:hypothetical protein